MSATIAEGAAYDETVAALLARGRFGIRLGLGRTRALLRALGDPQRSIRGALIAGTNGKGSVQAIVASTLGAAGYRVGQAPKPHLVDYRERIMVGGAPIGRAEFAGIVAEVLDAARRVPARLGPPTEFEVVTAAAFAWFARAGVQVGVIEVGLGGRLDATNAWDGGVAAVTNVAMDHAEILGGTIPRIAAEKSAIIKRGDRAVTGATGEALAVVRRRARRMDVPLEVAGPFPVLGLDRGGTTLDVPGLGSSRLGLIGRHQASNAAVALAVVDALEAAGVARVGPDARRDGLAAARWPGRMEVIDLDGLDLILDGAHNPAGARALAQALDDLRPSLAGGPMTLVLAAMRDKDVVGMVRELGSHEALRDGRMIAVALRGPRAMGTAELRDTWLQERPGSQAGTARAPGEALELALASARSSGGPIVVAGSLALVGAIRGIVLGSGV